MLPCYAHEASEHNTYLSGAHLKSGIIPPVIFTMAKQTTKQKQKTKTKNKIKNINININKKH
jgi:hypothetical protein